MPCFLYILPQKHPPNATVKYSVLSQVNIWSRFYLLFHTVPKLYRKKQNKKREKKVICSFRALLCDIIVSEFLYNVTNTKVELPGDKYFESKLSVLPYIYFWTLKDLMLVSFNAIYNCCIFCPLLVSKNR